MYDSYNGKDEESKDEAFQLALKRYPMALSAEEDQRALVCEDIEFALIEDHQWGEYEKRKRKKRPKYEINKIALAINQVIGDMLQSQISAKVRPSKGGTQEIANVYNGIIRNIEAESRFDRVKKNVAKSAFAGGFGCIELYTEYDEDSVDEQVIRIREVIDAPNCAFPDPASQEAMNRDAMFWFIRKRISRDAFKERFGEDRPPMDLEAPESEEVELESDRDLVTIAKYWCKKPYKKRVAKLSDGRTIEIGDDEEKVLDELAVAGVEIVAEREYDSYKVVGRWMDAGGWLTDEEEWAGKHIPVIPVYGYEMWHDGQHYYRGMVRLAKDPQRIYNYTTTAKIEQTALSNNHKPMITPRQVMGFEQDWSDTSPFGYRRFNSDPTVPGGAPLYPSPYPANGALIEQTQQAEQDIFATIGRQSQSLISNPRDQSGKALQTQKASADLGTHELMDQLAAAVKYVAEQLVDLIPKIMDTPRVERMLLEDGTDKLIPLNQEIIDEQTGQSIGIVDLNQGKYDVVPDIGPSFQSKRTEAVDTLSFLIQTNPALSQVTLDLLAKNMDFPFAPELEKRIRRMMIQQGIIDPNEQEMKEMQAKANTPQAQAEAQMQQMLVQLNLKMAEAEARAKAAEAMLKEIEINKNSKIMPAEIAQAAADVDKTESETVENYAQADRTRREPISSDKGE